MKKAKFTVIDDVFDRDQSSIGNPTHQQVVNNNLTYNIKEQIYKAINDIYKNFIMVKTGQFNNYGVYKSKVECYVCSDIRYIVAIEDNDNDPIGTTKPLSEINWISFQTRMTKDATEFKKFNIYGKTYTLPSKSILNDKVNKLAETREKTVYTPENLPLNIEVIHMKEDDTFVDKGTVIAALELFQTVITFNE